ncbi:hypothetical protein BJY04DRAFT_186989 [Aspergillus karnatakaensis]|uniref:uncharacterized protein n=1 Tax=Aspergillus karnatakaensis TaxID=1810916 RepID=UPI003CCD9593
MAYLIPFISLFLLHFAHCHLAFFIDRGMFRVYHHIDPLGKAHRPIDLQQDCGTTAESRIRQEFTSFTS